jgi:Fe-S-cluster containining protein
MTAFLFSINYLRLLFFMDLNEFNNKARFQKKENESFFRRLKNKPPKNIDELFHSAHDAVFENTDCLNCANCCKTTSPIFYQRDIERAAKALKLKPGIFIEKYLKVDEDQDFVLQKAPCPFLNEDNFCSIYNDRPTACREYPHTNRKKMHQILNLTFKNTLVCPAVLKITDELRKKLGN